LPYVINEWDNYAIEEAIQLKEKLGGTSTAVTMGARIMTNEKSCGGCLAMVATRAFPDRSGTW